MMRQTIDTRSSIAVLAIVAVAISLAAASQPGRAAPADAQSGVAGKGATGFFITNMDARQPATVTIELVSQADGSKYTLVKPDIAALPHTVYLPMETTVPDGVYAASITADRPIRAWTANHWSNGERDELGRAMVEDAVAAEDLVLPVVSRNYTGQSSIITIQNANPAAPATATIALVADGQTRAATMLTETLAPGASKTIDLDKDSRVAGLPDGFMGWARIRADQPVAASMLTQVKTETWPRGVHAWNAVPAATGPATVLHAPLAYNAFEGTTTGISILNPGANPVDVTVRYAGVGGTCAGLAHVHGTTAVAAGGSAVFYQGDVNLPGTGRSRLPNGCAAAAKIEATDKVVAVVVPAHTERGSSTAYRALSAAEAGRRVVLSPWRKGFVGDSAVHVVNPGAGDAQVSIAFFSGFEADPVACGAACQVTIPAGGAHRWAASDITAFPGGQFGNAVITSDQPVLAANIDTGGTIADSAQIGLAVAPGQRHLFPLAIKNAEWYPAPTPQPGSETATPGGTATREPTTTLPRATPTPAPPIAILDTPGSSGIQVYNVSDSNAADIEVTYQNQAGGAPIVLRRNGVPAGGTFTIYGPAEPLLPSGIFAATVRSTRPVDVLTGNVWGSRNNKGTYTDAIEPAADVILPHLTRMSTASSVVSIQNTDVSTAADVVLDLSGAVAGQQVEHARVRFVVPAGGGTTLALDRMPGVDLPTNWQGGGRITASVPMAVTVTTDLTTSTAAYAYAGIPADRIATELHAPLVANNYATHPGDPAAGTVWSGIWLHNPGRMPVTAAVTYRASNAPFNSAACSGTFGHGSGRATIEAGGSVLFAQGDFNMSVTGRSHLPVGCTASARVSASGPVAAVVAIGGTYGGRSAAYTAFGAAEGARRTRLPLVHREMVDRTTAIQVMNVGAGPATATLSATVGLLGQNIRPMTCGPECTVTIAPGGSHQWWPSAISGFPQGALGSAVVESDQPLLVVVHGISSDARDDTTIYRGYSATGATSSLVPLVLNKAVLGDLAPPPYLPAPTPTPGPPLVALPADMPARDGDGVTTPLRFSSYGHDAASLDLWLDYDQGWLAFDGADTDGNGLPNAIVSRLPADFKVVVEHDAAAGNAEIAIHVSSIGPAGTVLPEGDWLDVRLSIRREPSLGAKGLGFSDFKAVRVVDAAGRELPAEASGGWRPTVLVKAFLPWARPGANR